MVLCYHRYIFVTFDTSAHLFQYEKNEEVQEYFSHMFDTSGHLFQYEKNEEVQEYFSHMFDTSGHLFQYEKNEEVQEYFSHMLESMKHQSVFFDLGSILIKPVQRILKYPLLLNELYKVRSSNYNRASDACVCVCVNRLLERLMSPSPKSQVMFVSAFL